MRTVCTHDASTESVASRVNVASRMRTRDRVVVARRDSKCVCSNITKPWLRERRAGYTVLVFFLGLAASFLRILYSRHL